ncbi:MAG TPA: adenylate/guanylate cyclase domain-containing protein [Bacteroidales bacterium]|nr:adenylate/guanylate cyclase domain-containing protein [Bacteroidales bacterium]
MNFNRKCILAQCNQNLYLFSKDFAGEVIHDASGALQITEVNTTYPEKNWDPEDAVCSGDSIVLIANGKLWLYRGNSFYMLSYIDAKGYLFLQGNKIFLKDRLYIYELRKGKLIKTNIILVESDSLKYLDGKVFNPVQRGTNNLILKMTQVNNEISIPLNDIIVKTFSDTNHNLWALSTNALYCIRYTDYFKYIANLPPQSRLKGIAKNSTGTYLADDYRIISPDLSYSQISDEPVKQIFSLCSRILYSTSRGVYQLTSKESLLIVARPISYISTFNDRALFISKGHLFSLRLMNDKVALTELFNLKLDSIYKIIYRKNGDLLILDKQNSIHLLKVKDNHYSFEILYRGMGDYVPQISNMFVFNNSIYVCNAFNIYKIEGNKLINQEKSPLNFPSQGHFIEYLKGDNTGSILYSTCKPGENKHIYYGKKSASKLNWLEIPIWEGGLKNPAILSSNSKEVNLYENGKLITLDLTNFLNQETKIQLRISEVTINNRAVQIFYKKNSETLPFIKAQYPVNLLSLKFRANDLNYPGHIQYSFLVKDKDAEWSSWTQFPEKNFSNLPAGEYQLLVKAQTINGSVSNTLTLLIKIAPPFYLQWYAWMIYALFVLGLIGLIAFRRKKTYERERIKLESIIQERTSELIREKEKTDELLANMLPKDTADELKNTGKASSHKFDMVTVLFSDIQGFTKIAEQMNPEKLVDELDNFFFQFDSVVERYNIEKIKTIGDAYMAAGGIPYKNRTNPVEVVLAALEMQEYMKNLKRKNTDIWDLRIGIHTGAVIAGVVGHKRISYDIWGDTVNTASRMESSGEAGKINVSGHTYELVKDFFICEYRGKMPVKYKGDIDMYFVKGIRPELSVNLRSIPNKKFFIQLQLLRIQDLEELVFNKLEAEIPSALAFHNLKHTKDVYTQVELIGRAENITSEEMLTLRTAALMHDTGFIWSYQNHEAKSVEFCRDILPKFKYTDEQIDIICNLIQCTRVNYEPKNKIEGILIDANTDFWGRIDFIPALSNLLDELKLHYPHKNEEDWLMGLLTILENHEYYTDTARRLREVPKAEQIQKIKDHLKLFVD